MHGGPSQVDTFDYKPLLKRDHGKPLPFQRPKVVSSETYNLLKSPWEFKQYGQSGMWVSDLFPEIRQSGGRRLLHQVDVGLELAARRRAAGDAHGQRYVCAAVDGVVDHLRAGQREPEHAGLHHHLPDAEPRRRQQLLLGISAGAVRRNADRRGGNQGAGRAAFRTSRIRRRRRTSSGWNWISCSGSIASNWNRPGRTRRWKGASNRSNWRSGCSRKRRACRTSRGSRRPRASCTGWTTA